MRGGQTAGRRFARCPRLLRKRAYGALAEVPLGKPGGISYVLTPFSAGRALRFDRLHTASPAHELSEVATSVLSITFTPSTGAGSLESRSHWVGSGRRPADGTFDTGISELNAMAAWVAANIRSGRTNLPAVSSKDGGCRSGVPVLTPIVADPVDCDVLLGGRICWRGDSNTIGCLNQEPLELPRVVRIMTGEQSY